MSDTESSQNHVVATMTEQQIANRRAAIRWGALVVGLLGVQVAGGIAAIIVATSDESFAVVPDYHQKALQWDDEVALRRASADLGWTAQLDVGRMETGPAGLRLKLANEQGEVVPIVTGSIEIYHHARAADVRRFPIEAGPVAIDLGSCFESNGLWQVSLDVVDDAGNRFVDSQVVNVERESGGA